MNASDTLALIEALKKAKASHFKSQDFEVSFGVDAEQEEWNPAPKESSPAQPVVAAAENKEATEKLKSLIETLKLPDDQLLDAIFPAGAGG